MRKIALITGGSRGIGRACVELFAQAGWSVVFFCHTRRDLAETLTADCRQRGLDVSWMQVDVADRRQVTEAVENILRTYRHIDALVNNAGIAHIGLMTDMAEEEWDRLFDVNVKGVFHTCQAVLPGMISQGGGAVVNVSSMWGEVGASCEAAYSAAKAAVIGLTKALAKEVGPSGVRVNCVSPGVIDTDMNAELDEDALRSLQEETPLGRLGTPEDVAKAVLFLAEDGSSFMTGQVLGISGGLVV